MAVSNCQAGTASLLLTANLCVLLYAAAVFAAKLLTLQANGKLPLSNGPRPDQVKLFTYGSPRVGDTFFAAYLENNMRERYR
jgi:predicted lipase